MLDHRIETFLVLYEKMNYRKTAELLNMTQPGVTQHIQYLESHYGVKLFEYNGRALSRTRNAELLKKHFDSIRSEELDVKKRFSDGERIKIRVGATKTIGEFVILPQIRRFIENEANSLDLVVDNTVALLSLLENAELDFAVIEGVFDKSRYGYHLFKKEAFVGICASSHPFANKRVSLSEAFGEHLIVRESGSGTRRLLEQAINDKGYTFDSFKRCTSISNFSVICDVVKNEGAITFAYEPVSHSRDGLATFELEDIYIKGEFNYVYCNERVAREKIAVFLGEEMERVD